MLTLLLAVSTVKSNVLIEMTDGGSQSNTVTISPPSSVSWDIEINQVVVSTGALSKHFNFDL